MNCELICKAPDYVASKGKHPIFCAVFFSVAALLFLYIGDFPCADFSEMWKVHQSLIFCVPQRRYNAMMQFAFTSIDLNGAKNFNGFWICFKCEFHPRISDFPSKNILDRNCKWITKRKRFITLSNNLSVSLSFHALTWHIFHRQRYIEYRWNLLLRWDCRKKVQSTMFVNKKKRR